MSTSARQLLVTGASGFLGSSIVDLAVQAGWQVRAFSRNPGKRVEGIETFVGDIADVIALRRACEGAAAIIHAAGLAHVFGSSAGDSVRFNLVNEIGTANVVDTAVELGIPRIVLVSSVSVYGNYSGDKCDETASCYPQSAYAMSKWRGERAAAERIAKRHGSLTILRLATIYGEGDRGNVVKLIGALDRGRFLWPGSGQNRKSLIYKADAARACICALDRQAPGTEVFNVSAPPVSMREIVTAICQALGRPVPRYSIPPALLKIAEAISGGIGDPGQLGQRLRKFLDDDVYDGSKFESSFNFRAAFSLTEGMRREVEFLQARTGR